ncbi:MAG: energy transducer TonB [Rikenellaceae bacterium]|jgi:hypothetical protein|nr:energy transducer TonB [Rikenellaceae bacterium]
MAEKYPKKAYTWSADDPEEERRDAVSESAPETERMDLPFAPQGRDWAEWAYDHRRGLMVMVVAYLVLGAALAFAKITLTPSDPYSAFYVEMDQLQELIEEKERLEEQVRQMQALQEMEREYEAIRNRASNAEGELDAELRDAQGTEAAQIYDEARALEARMEASRQAYEEGLQSASDILNNRPQSGQDAAQESQTGRQSGRVTVSYYLPGRTDRRLPVPSYQCQGGGTVVINIEADANGRITKAAPAGGGAADACLQEYALRAARNSRFNTDGSFGNAQAGTITYEFVAQ